MNDSTQGYRTGTDMTESSPDQMRLSNDDLLRHFRHAVEQGPVIVMITDVKGMIEYVNPKFEEVTGYPPAEVIGQNPRFLQSGETSREQYKDLWKTVTAGNEWRGVFLNKKKSGDHYWERAIISPVVDSNGTVSHFVGLKEDITGLRVVEREIEEQRLKYFHQSKMADVGLLTASILHEVASPISAMHGIITKLLEEDKRTHQPGDLDEELRLALTLIERLSDITAEVSEFTSPQDGGRELLDLNGVVRSTCHLVQFDKRWKNIALSLDLDRSLPAIYGYKDQFSHLLMNLLMNAADAVTESSNQSSQIKVSTQKNDDNVNLCVQDNGIGMTDDVIELAKDAFFTTKKAGKGTGLGLSLCDSIIANHQGNLNIQSVLGLGTEMIITLPIKAAP